MRGYALVFNHKNFKINESERVGTQHDVLALKNVFEKFNIYYEIYPDYTFYQIATEVERLKKFDFKDNSYLAVIILTHGDNNNILCAKDQKYNLFELIINPIVDNNESLAEKPKIFIVQACKGQNSHCCFHKNNVDATGSSPKIVIPSKINICIAYSTYEGFVSERNSIIGGHFIQSLCKHINENGSRDTIEAIMRRVTKELNKNIQQVPMFSSTLSEEFYFGERKVNDHNSKDLLLPQLLPPELFKHAKYVCKQKQLAIQNQQQKQRSTLKNRVFKKSQRNRFNKKQAANENSSKDILSDSEVLTTPEDYEFIQNAEKNDKIDDTTNSIQKISPYLAICINDSISNFWPFPTSLQLIKKHTIVKIFYTEPNFCFVKIQNIEIKPKLQKTKLKNFSRIPNDFLPFISDIKDFSKYEFTIEHIQFILNLREGDLIINIKSESQNVISIIRFIKAIPEYGPGIYFGVENFIDNCSMKLNDEVISIIKNNFSCILTFADILSVNDILPVPEDFDSGRYIATFDKRQALFIMLNNNNNYTKENYQSEDTQLDIYAIPKDNHSNKYISKRASHNKSKNSTYDEDRNLNMPDTNIDEDLLIKEFVNASMETEEIPNCIINDDEILKDLQRKLEIQKQEQYLKSQLNLKNSIDNQSNNYSGRYQNNNYPENKVNENKSSHKHRSFIDQSNLNPVDIINQFRPDYVKKNSLLNYKDEHSTAPDSYIKYLEPTFKDQKDHLHNSKRVEMKNQNGNKHSITKSNPNTMIFDNSYNTFPKNQYTGTIPKSTTQTNSYWYVNPPRDNKPEKTELPIKNEINDSHQEEPQITLTDGYSEELDGLIITCKKSDCNGGGFLDAEDKSQFFICPNCKSYNCLQCKVIHTGFTCQEYINNHKSNENIKLFMWECDFCSEKVSSQNKTCLHCNEGKIKNAVIHLNKSVPASNKQTNKKNETKNKKQPNSEKQIVTENKSAANDKNLYSKKESIARNSLIDNWLCKTCSFNNTINEYFCEICRDRKDKPCGDQIDINSSNNIQNVSEKNNKWQCKYCTFENDVDIDSIICRVCCKTDEVLRKIKMDKEFTLVENKKQKNENKQKKTINLINGEWICVYCSFTNQREFKTCGNCKYRNDPAKKNVFKCLTPNCNGWWPHDGKAVKMKCPICFTKNCLSCKAIHSGKNCEDYQQPLLNRFNIAGKSPKY